MTEKLTIVVPVYNEEVSLKILLPSLIKFTNENNTRLIIVNDGSTDGSDAIIEPYSRDAGFTYIRHKKNKGYGAALKAGIETADTEYVVSFDADGQHLPEDILRLQAKITGTDADMVIGSRVDNKGSETIKRFGKYIIRELSKILIQNEINDLNAGMKMMRTDLAKRYIKICPDTFAFSDVITLVFISEKNIVLEEPIQVVQRKNGKSKITMNTAFETILEIINISVLFNPLRVFLPLTFFFLVIGFGWSLKIVLEGKGVSVGGSLLIVLGILCFLIGLVAEQLSFIKKRLM
ncbi:MAG: glycosyltransferase family 2 protein [Ignavibacteriae bacterium]|nr:glycosyltransferase family 2 protein [Ignavibacteriota bacterium]